LVVLEPLDNELQKQTHCFHVLENIKRTKYILDDIKFHSITLTLSTVLLHKRQAMTSVHTQTAWAGTGKPTKLRGAPGCVKHIHLGAYRAIATLNMLLHHGEARWETAVVALDKQGTFRHSNELENEEVQQMIRVAIAMLNTAGAGPLVIRTEGPYVVVCRQLSDQEKVALLPHNRN
jgi:hypothetical protein